jgi:hypothetical protein
LSLYDIINRQLDVDVKQLILISASYRYSGLPPKTSRRNPANGMTTGKQKDKEVANWSKGAGGFS